MLGVLKSTTPKSWRKYRHRRRENAMHCQEQRSGCEPKPK